MSETEDQTESTKEDQNQNAELGVTDGENEEGDVELLPRETPDPAETYVEQSVHNGNGCSDQIGDAWLSPDLKHLYVDFGYMTARQGNNLPLSEMRKVCSSAVRIEVPAGWTYAIEEVSMEYTARLSAGSVAQVVNSTYFQANSETVVFNEEIQGPALAMGVSTGALLTAQASCEVQRDLILKSEVRVQSPAGEAGRVSVRGPVQYSIVWSRCP
jgi:hypothetical protein